MKDWRMNPGDYRHECDPTRMLDDVPATTAPEHVQHVFSKGRMVGGHSIRRDSEGVVRCSYRNCILNKGRIWKTKQKAKK